MKNKIGARFGIILSFLILINYTSTPAGDEYPFSSLGDNIEKFLAFIMDAPNTGTLLQYGPSNYKNVWIKVCTDTDEKGGTEFDRRRRAREKKKFIADLDKSINEYHNNQYYVTTGYFSISFGNYNFDQGYFSVSVQLSSDEKVKEVFGKLDLGINSISRNYKLYVPQASVAEKFAKKRKNINGNCNQKLYVVIEEAYIYVGYTLRGSAKINNNDINEKTLKDEVSKLIYDNYAFLKGYSNMK